MRLLKEGDESPGQRDVLDDSIREVLRSLQATDVPDWPTTPTHLASPAQDHRRFLSGTHLSLRDGMAGVGRLRATWSGEYEALLELVAAAVGPSLLKLQTSNDDAGGDAELVCEALRVG